MRGGGRCGASRGAGSASLPLARARSVDPAMPRGAVPGVATGRTLDDAALNPNPRKESAR
ncbi:protein of unknown function (plasmid) [Streptantibioticus cattleyicolor NRRL 8057 = DSM 46488]|nr:protein of unknown function [Streptantibioticus cattleyicolor NRRL 8057 = DSM 46488]